jgi:acetaldehyde dehydrogenase
MCGSISFVDEDRTPTSAPIPVRTIFHIEEVELASKASVAIVGSGNISTDLLYKLLRSEWLEPRWMIGIDPESEGLARARKLGLETSAEGADWLLAQDELPDFVFEATSAYVHKAYAPKYEAAGIRAIDLTPAAVGPAVIPPANLHEHVDAPNVNMITCGGQATIPIVYAVSRAVKEQGGVVPYAEIVASVASVSAGPGTRANIDEFTKTTSRGVETIGGAQKGKAIIILNPADPPMIMRDTIFCQIPEDVDRDAITKSIRDVVAQVQTYVPGYRLLNEPQFDEPSLNSGGRAVVTTFVEVEGAGDYLPPYAGNLDIMTAAATKVGEEIARELATAKAGGAK